MSLYDDAKAQRSGRAARIVGGANQSTSESVMAGEGANGTPPIKHRVDNTSHAELASRDAKGKKSKARFDRPARARGGAVRGKGKTNVTVIVAPQGGGQPPQVAVGAGAGPVMPAGNPSAAMGPSGAPPMQPRPPMTPPMGAGAPAMPMRKRGGPVMKAGAGSGVGRLEKEGL